MSSPSPALDAIGHAVMADLRGPAQAIPLQICAETGSTNADLLNAEAWPQHPTLVLLALAQTEGRGRSGRQWLSDGGSLTFSVRWPFSRSTSQLLGLPLAVAVAVVQGLEDLSVAGLSIKWPNDLLRRGRKVGGILVELSGQSAVIGIGLNIALDAALAASLDQMAADVQPMQGPAIQRETVLAAILNRLVPALSVFNAEGFGAFQSDWATRAAWLGRAVRLGPAGSEVAQGTLCGVDAHGALLIEQQGRVSRYLVGDLSLRPMHDPAAESD